MRVALVRLVFAQLALHLKLPGAQCLGPDLHGSERFTGDEVLSVHLGESASNPRYPPSRIWIPAERC